MNAVPAPKGDWFENIGVDHVNIMKPETFGDKVKDFIASHELSIMQLISMDNQWEHISRADANKPKEVNARR